MLELRLLDLSARVITTEDKILDMILISRCHMDYNEKILAASEGEGDGQVKYGKNANERVSGSTFQGMTGWSGNKDADLLKKTHDLADTIRDAYVNVRGERFMAVEKEKNNEYTYLISIERLGKKRILEIKTDNELLGKDFEKKLKEAFFNVKYNEKMIEKTKEYFDKTFQFLINAKPDKE